MPHFYEHINLLIMPTDACNMNCVYCFHKPYSKTFDVMNIKTFKHLLDITTPHYKKINIIWHGGEPLLMGLAFYEEALKLQQNYQCKITNSMQSNLTLLTPEFADFITKNDIDISSSFDGICNEALRGYSEKITTCRQLILERGKKCGFIMVVSALNINKLIESYLYFKNINVNFSLNLYLDQKDNPQPMLQLEERNAIRRLNELFDYWATDMTGRTRISYFDNILEFILFKRKSLCSFTSCLGRWLGVHYDGELTPCNRYFPNKYSYGNLHNYQDIGEAFDSIGFRKLIQHAIKRRDKCKSCEIYDLCNGGCNNTALNEKGIESNDGLSCKILKAVYKHVCDFLTSIPQSNFNNSLNPLLVSMLEKSSAKT